MKREQPRSDGFLILRYTTLMAGTLLAALVLCRVASCVLAWAESVCFSLAFLVGLRLRAALGIARNDPGKDLSWGNALVASVGVTIAFEFLARPAYPKLIFYLFGIELLVFYLVGKLTCEAAGCCRSKIALPVLMSLPRIEIVLTCLSLTAGVAFLSGSTGASLLALTVGHLLTRAISRIARSHSLRSLAAVDICVLSLAVFLEKFVP